MQPLLCALVGLALLRAGAGEWGQGSRDTPGRRGRNERGAGDRHREKGREGTEIVKESEMPKDRKRRSRRKMSKRGEAGSERGFRDKSAWVRRASEGSLRKAQIRRKEIRNGRNKRGKKDLGKGMWQPDV